MNKFRLLRLWAYVNVFEYILSVWQYATANCVALYKCTGVFYGKYKCTKYLYILTTSLCVHPLFV